MNKLSIIGAGFSTAVLCHYLQNKDVQIFEKSRGPGGRSSTRKVDDIGVLITDFNIFLLKLKSFRNL